MIIINNGPDIASTTYWGSEHASVGMCFLSANAGTLRLLVPEAAQGMLPEMRTGKRASVERSMHDARLIDIVFEDGTDAPFSLAIDRLQTDRALAAGKCRLAVWTQAGGKVMDLPCTVAAGLTS